MNSLLVLSACAVLWGLPAAAAPAGVLKGARGPAGKTEMAAPRPAADSDYRDGGTSRLVILLTDPDSAWLGLVHGLKSMGVPFRITRDYKDALRHRVVLVYPIVSGKVLTPEALGALAKFPEMGGTLIAVDVEGGGLQGVFGFASIAPSRTRGRIELDGSNPAARGLDDERERRFHFSNPQHADQTVGSVGYIGALDPPLARFEDGTAAVTSRLVGRGGAYAFGVDPGFLILKGYNNREQGIARAYVNEFEPAIDVILRLITNIYRAGEPSAVILHTVPEGKDLSVVLTHDVDYAHSVANALRYAEYERKAGVRATYFIQTKYIRDWNDAAFFNERAVAELIELRGMGGEIASHSVAHSRVFSRFPLGSGEEGYPEYRPFVKTRTETQGGTILGELRVSRHLLESSIPGSTVRSFRPGHLQNPYQLPQALEACGYRYSSSVTANNSLTHLPFRLTYGRETSAESAVYEFPVTIEDEKLPPLEGRLPAALKLAGKLSRYGALMMVLIHTNVVEPKLGFERGLVEALRDRAWFGPLEDFGDFWAARDRVELDVTPNGTGLTVSLRAPAPVRGLTLTPPPGYRLASSQPPQLSVREADGRLVISDLSGEATVVLAPR